MEITAFAEQVLFSTDLALKLWKPESFTDEEPRHSLLLPEKPARAGRHQFAQDPCADRFPSVRHVHKPAPRASMLHFFANHELMALELMAMALLKFQDAPAEFRLGIAHTMLEEQRHFQLYQERIQALGVDFGDEPLSGFFWNALSGMQTPLDYVTQLSMTFEQANLDYAQHYRRVFQEVDDHKSADVMKIIYDDEIGHLAYGVQWFEHWREPGPSTWAAYCAALPNALSPTWARGIGYATGARRQAGLSEGFIRELKVCSRSKRRPSEILFFNAIDDSGALLQAALFAAHGSDIVLAPRPSLKFLELMDNIGVDLPEFIEPAEAIDTLGGRKHFSTFEATRWEGMASTLYSLLKDRLVSKGLIGDGTSPSQKNYEDPPSGPFIPRASAVMAHDFQEERLSRNAPEHLKQYFGVHAVASSSAHEFLFTTDIAVGARKASCMRLTPHGDFVLGQTFAGLPLELTRFLHDATRAPAPMARMRELLDFLCVQLFEGQEGGKLTMRVRVYSQGDSWGWHFSAFERGLTTAHIAAAVSRLVHRGCVGVWSCVERPDSESTEYMHQEQWINALSGILPWKVVRQGKQLRIAQGVLPTNDPAQASALQSLLMVHRDWNALPQIRGQSCPP